MHLCSVFEECSVLGLTCGCIGESFSVNLHVNISRPRYNNTKQPKAHYNVIAINYMQLMISVKQVTSDLLVAVFQGVGVWKSV